MASGSACLCQWVLKAICHGTKCTHVDQYVSKLVCNFSSKWKMDVWWFGLIRKSSGAPWHVISSKKLRLPRPPCHGRNPHPPRTHDCSDSSERKSVVATNKASKISTVGVVLGLGTELHRSQSNSSGVQNGISKFASKGNAKSKTCQSSLLSW